MRDILHCDLNGFFASVECLKRPELKNVPMAVCGDPDTRHGVILAKNEIAKKYGVVTAETIYSAKKKCPKLVLVKSNHSDYIKYSKLVNNIYYPRKHNLFFHYIRGNYRNLKKILLVLLFEQDKKNKIHALHQGWKKGLLMHIDQ